MRAVQLLCRLGPYLAGVAFLGLLVCLFAGADRHRRMFRAGRSDEVPFFDPRCSNQTLAFSNLDDHVVVDGDLDLGSVMDVLRRSWKVAIQTANAAKSRMDILNLTDREKAELKRLANSDPSQLPTDRGEAEKRVRFASTALQPLQEKRKRGAPSRDRQQAHVVFAGTAGQFVWKDGVVPYFVDADIPDRAQILEAMQLWQSRTRCVRFKARDQETDFVRFLAGGDCLSGWVGKMGGVQTVTLEPNCGLPQIVHEVGHVLGLFHEHNRPDRDEYLSLQENNFEDRVRDQFFRNPVINEDNGRPDGAFDWQSIMLYPPTAFSKNHKPTLLRKDNSTDLKWGLYTGPGPGPGPGDGVTKVPSSGDIAAIEQLYRR